MLNKELLHYGLFVTLMLIGHSVTYINYRFSLHVIPTQLPPKIPTPGQSILFLTQSYTHTHPVVRRAHH